MFGSLIPFIGTTLLLAMVPGPTTAVILRQALWFGPRSAVATALGNSSGLLIWGLAAAFGLSGLLAASQTAYNALRFVGAGVLIVFGVRTLLNAGHNAQPLDREDERAIPLARTSSAWVSFRTGVLTNLTNPKAAVFAVSFLPQFVPIHAPLLTTTIVLALVWATVAGSWYMVLIAFVDRVRSLLAGTRAQRLLQQTTGIVLIGFGARLAFQQR